MKSLVSWKKTQSRRRSRLHWPGKEEDTVESQDYYRSKVWVQIRSVKQNMRKIILFYLPNWGFWIRFGPTEVEKFVLSKLVQNRISIIIIRFRPNTHKPLFGRPLIEWAASLSWPETETVLTILNILIFTSFVLVGFYSKMAMFGLGGRFIKIVKLVQYFIIVRFSLRSPGDGSDELHHTFLLQ